MAMWGKRHFLCVFGEIIRLGRNCFSKVTKEVTMFKKLGAVMAALVAITLTVACGDDSGSPPTPQDASVLAAPPCDPLIKGVPGCPPPLDGHVLPDQIKKADATSADLYGTCPPGTYVCKGGGEQDICQIDTTCDATCSFGGMWCLPGKSPLSCNGGEATCTIYK